MNFEKLLEEFLKLPKDLNEAIAFVKRNPIMNSTIEELAFKQTVINVLIAAGLVSENDFNASVEYFKNKLYEDFGKELLREAQELELQESEEDEEESDEWLDDDLDSGKKYYDA